MYHVSILHIYCLFWKASLNKNIFLLYVSNVKPFLTKSDNHLSDPRGCTVDISSAQLATPLNAWEVVWFDENMLTRVQCKPVYYIADYSIRHRDRILSTQPNREERKHSHSLLVRLLSLFPNETLDNSKEDYSVVRHRCDSLQNNAVNTRFKEKINTISDFFMAAIVQREVFWAVISCGYVSGYKLFRKNYCFHFQFRRWRLIVIPQF
jgi:hypothetical protein